MKKILKWTVLLVLAAAVFLVLGVVADGWKLYRNAVEARPVTEAVAAVQSDEHYTTLEQMPALYPKAVVAVEDRRFYDHGGVDPIAVGRAVWTNLRTGTLAEGGSTLTQQLAKNLYFTQEKKVTRKVAEVFVAWDLERLYDKDEILELYINSIYYGDGYYGIYSASEGYFTRKVAEVFVAWDLERLYDKDEILELYINSIYYGDGYYGIYSASEGYFGKAPADMTDYECTLLAGVPNAPSVYAPTVNPDLAAQRQRQVVDSLVDTGELTAGQAQAILAGG